MFLQLIQSARTNGNKRVVVAQNHGRFLASSSSTPSTTATAAPASSGASLWQRLVSFTIGAGISALVSQYYLFVQVRQGNKEMIKKQKQLEDRILKLEKKY